jgi:ATP-binding cassette subfamily C protein
MVVVGLLVLAGFGEGISVLALLPLIDVVVSAKSGTSDVGQWFAQGLTYIGLTPSVGWLLALIVAGFLVKAAVTLAAMKEVGFAVARMMTDLRQRLIAALMAARWSYFVGRPLGVFANAIGAETIRAGATCLLAARFAAAVVQAIVYGVATLLVSWQVALLAVVGGLIGAVVFRRIVRTAHVAGDRQTDLMRSLAVRTTDTLQGIKPIKAMGAEQAALPLLNQEIRELDEQQRKQVWSAELLRVAQEPVLVLFLAAGIFVAIEAGGQSLPTLMVLAAIFYRLFNRFQVIQEIYQQIGTGASAYWSMQDLCREAEHQAEEMHPERSITTDAPRIEFASVSFRYGDKPVLRDVSLCIEPGEFVAVTGASGGGKTTLLDLLAGLLTPTSGQVRIDGIDLGKIDLRAWRGRLGYVPQEPLLLHDTVFRNICLGDQSISRAHAQQALLAAGLWDTIAELPDGMDTIVGERGSRFSGGQRQRISLARALVRNPSVLLLDEITAALDKDTEQEICATLKSLAGKITLLAVSHQPALIGVAGRAFQLHDGKMRILSSSPTLLPVVEA